MEMNTIDIDLAKNVFQLYGSDANGKPVLSKRLRRNSLLTFLATLPKCRIGIEACSGSHYWAREFQKLGHEVKMIAPKFVKPYVKGNKNDYRDAEAINEAMCRGNMRFVSQKS